VKLAAGMAIGVTGMIVWHVVGWPLHRVGVHAHPAGHASGLRAALPGMAPRGGDLMDDDDEQQPSYLTPEAAEARDKVSKAISEYLQVVRPGEDPYVVAWVVGAEWTNATLEQTGRAGRDVIMPQDQSIAASCGLGVYITNRFG